MLGEPKDYDEELREFTELIGLDREEEVRFRLLERLLPPFKQRFTVLPLPEPHKDKL